MNKKLLLVIMVLLASLATSCSKEVALSKKQDAELKQQLSDYINELQSVAEGSESDLEARKNIIELAQKLSSPPEVPEETDRLMARGSAAVNMATDKSGFERAIEEFKNASRTAPWLAEAYYNLGITQEKAGDLKGSIKNLKLYLLAAPDAEDVDQVKNHIYEIEYKMEETARLQAEKQRQKMADERLAEQLVGIWHQPSTQGKGFNGQPVTLTNGYRIKIRREGTNIYADCIGVPCSNQNFTKTWYGSYGGLPLPYMKGKIENGEFIGTVNGIAYGQACSIYETKPYRSKINMNYDGMSYTAINPHSDEGKEYTMLKEW